MGVVDSFYADMGADILSLVSSHADGKVSFLDEEGKLTLAKVSPDRVPSGIPCNAAFPQQL